MKIKRIVAALLFACLLINCLPLLQTNAATEGDYTYEITDGKATITDYIGTGGDITIPSTLEGYPVTAIGDEAFWYCYSLTSVVIGDNVTSIGNSAFYGCTRLTSVTIPDSVTSIGEGAFKYCGGRLTDIYITDVEAWCNISFGDSDANPLRVNYAEKKLYLQGELIVDLMIPDGVTSIGDYAFYLCSSLESVEIPDSVTTIGDSAFTWCTSLTSIEIPDSVTTIGSSAFHGCTGLTSVTIPDSVTAIGSSAFHGCTGLTSVTIPDSVTTIGDEAFRYCYSLTSVTIPDSVITIGDGTFVECTSLIEICVDANNPCYSSENGALLNKQKTVLLCLPGGFNGQYTVPNSVSSIDSYAFYCCINLTSVVIPDSVISIDESAFYFCISLTGIWVDENNPDYCNDSHGVLFNKDKTKLIQAPAGGIYGHYMIPDSVTAIGDFALSYCSCLESVAIPDSVITIGDSAFEDCNSLTSVTIGCSVKTIGSHAFSHCRGLTSITILNGVTTIDTYAFYVCENLTTVMIGNSVTSIADYAFDSCGNLASVVYCGTEEQWNTININNNTNLLNVQRQYHDYQDGVCTICGHTEQEKHDHTWEDGACTICGQELAEAIDLSGDGKITAFDAQILAEAKAGLRELMDEQWQALGDLQVSDIIDYVLGRFPGMKTEE